MKTLADYWYINMKNLGIVAMWLAVVAIAAILQDSFVTLLSVFTAGGVTVTINEQQ